VGRSCDQPNCSINSECQQPKGTLPQTLLNWYASTTRFHATSMTNLSSVDWCGILAQYTVYTTRVIISQRAHFNGSFIVLTSRISNLPVRTHNQTQLVRYVLSQKLGTNRFLRNCKAKIGFFSLLFAFFKSRM
jgi:hypothetical protein